MNFYFNFWLKIEIATLLKKLKIWNKSILFPCIPKLLFRFVSHTKSFKSSCSTLFTSLCQSLLHSFFFFISHFAIFWIWFGGYWNTYRNFTSWSTINASFVIKKSNCNLVQSWSGILYILKPFSEGNTALNGWINSQVFFIFGFL